jgi:hypothetical protein
MTDICRQGDNTLDSRIVPIIFAPGVMGSRLHFPTVDEYWDPDSSWRMLHWVRISAERERQEIGWRARGDIMTTGDNLTASELRRGYASVAAGFYVGFLRFLTGLTSLCAKTPVYAVGYDWRQSNKDSASYLDTQITTILAQEKADNFVLITHSMGGIVARACLLANASGNSGKLLGVIHIVQPAAGAPVFYRRMYTGAIKAWDGGRGLSYIQGTTAQDFATILSGLRGPCELVPTDAYHDTGSIEWLWDDRTTPPSNWPPPIFSVYAMATAPPGIWWSVAGVTTKVTPTPEADLRARIAEADAFHSWLARYRHPNTWAIYSTGVVTDMAARFNKSPANHGIVAIRRDQGDETVPATSASSLFSAAATSTDVTGAAFVSNTALRQCEVRGVTHGDACNNTTVQTVVEQMLKVALGCCGDVNPPADVVPDTPPSDQQLASADTPADQPDGDLSGDTPPDPASDADDSSAQDLVASADAPAPEDWSTDMEV